MLVAGCQVPDGRCQVNSDGDRPLRQKSDVNMEVKLAADVILLPLTNRGTSAETLSLVRARVAEKMQFLMNSGNENIAAALFEEWSWWLSCRAANHYSNGFINPLL